MRGSEWNRLVSEPTPSELDAALAEVRVRAVPIARRQSRNRDLSRGLAVLLIGVAGIAAGRATASGLRITPTDDAGAHEITSGEPGHEVVPGGYIPVPGRHYRWHITAGDEVEGVRINAGEAWVEGPEGTHLSISFWSLGAKLEATARLSYSGDTTVMWIYGESSHTLGSHGAASINARVTLRKHVQLLPGESLVLLPFGTGGYVRTTLRIDGPYAPGPDAGVRWMTPDTLHLAPNTREAAAAMIRAGIRHGYRGFSGLGVGPIYDPPGP